MVTLSKVLVVSVVVLLVLPAPSATLECQRTAVREKGCHFYQLLRDNDWCEAEIYNSSGFSFYIKPRHDFKRLVITMDIKESTENYEIGVNREDLRRSDEWHKIHLWSSDSGSVYHLFVDDEVKEIRTISNVARFTIWIFGSLFYSSQCLPDHFQLIYIIGGVGLTIMILIIIIIIVIIKRKIRKVEIGEGGDRAVKDGPDVINTAANPRYNPEGVPSPNPSFSEFDDPSEHIYEEPMEVHIYENLNVSGGTAVSFAKDDVPQASSLRDVMLEKRGIFRQESQASMNSAHNSENSLYNCL